MACNIDEIREILSEQFSGKELDTKVEEYKAAQTAALALNQEVKTTIDTILERKGTTEDINVSQAHYMKLSADLTTDPEKAIEFAKELRGKDGVTISDQHAQSLLDTLNMFLGNNKKFIRGMNVYLNDKAKENKGIIVFQDEGDTKKGVYLDTYNGAQTAGNQMSAMEVYVHELMHAATEYALNLDKEGVSNQVARLRKLQSDVMATMTIETLLPKHSSYSKEEEIKIAEARLAHLRSKEGLSEFIALGLTNEQVKAKIANTKVYREKVKAKNLWEALVEMIGMLFDTAFQIKRKESKDKP